MTPYKFCCTNDLRLPDCNDDENVAKKKKKKKFMPEEQPEDSNKCDMRKLRRSPFPWPGRFRRLSNRTTTRTINTTKRTAASDATTITMVDELTLVLLSPSLLSAPEEIAVESVNKDRKISS